MKPPTDTLTTDTVVFMAAQPSDRPNPLPEFVRLPEQGKRCPLTGLSRGAMNALILGNNPSVKSSCLRRKGATRGIRLIVTSSLMEYIYSNIKTKPDGQVGPAQ